MKQQHCLFESPADDVELEVALGMAAAAFRARHASRENRSGTPGYRSERAQRVGRAYLEAIHAFLREGSAARKPGGPA